MTVPDLPVVPGPGDRVVVWVRSPGSDDFYKPERGVLIRVDLWDWCDVLLDSGTLLTREHHIREVILESAHDAIRE